jgi:plastocyanin
MRDLKKISPWLCCLTAGIAFVLPSFALGAEITAQVHVRSSDAVKKSMHFSDEGVVIWLTPVNVATAGADAAPPKGRLQLAQKNKEFVPHLLVVQVGSVVEFPNLDPFFHNVFSQFNGKRFDLGLYESGTTKSVHFNRQGVSYIFCNIHPEMSAVVVAVPTPYYASSSATGALTIHDVAPGVYEMHVWAMGSSELSLSDLERRVVVSAGSVNLGTVTVDEAAVTPHSNKFGEPYLRQSSNY